MGEEADVDSGLMVAEDKQMNEENRESEMGSFLERQVTVMMTDDKITEVMTLSKEKGEEKLSLGKLGSSPVGSFQSLQSSQNSEEDKMIPFVPQVGETRVL